MYLEEFDRLVKIMNRLRKECPWDKEQTPQTLRQYILEEAYETVEMIDDENWPELRKELGDLLLQIVFQAEIAQENDRFTLAEVIANISQKLIDRHPHVFGDTTADTAEAVKDNWEQIKLKSENRKSVLEGVPKTLNALLRAQRLQDKASQVGFDWDDAGAVLDKVQEEIQELKDSRSPQEIEEEMGDVLFSLVNLCRFYKISAEDALRKTTDKFTTRFQYIEQKLAESSRPVREASLAEMEALWQEAKSLPDQKNK